MHKRIIFRSMAYSQAAEKYIYKKIEKIYKFFKREPLPVTIDVMLEPNRDKDSFKVACKINSVRYHIDVNVIGFDIYAAIDQVVMRTVKEITKKKEKLVHDSHLGYSF